MLIIYLFELGGIIQPFWRGSHKPNWIHTCLICVNVSHTHSQSLSFCRLPSVTVLNGSVVTEGEREDAERFFIRHYLDCSEETLPQRYCWHTYTLQSVEVELLYVRGTVNTRTHFSSDKNNLHLVHNSTSIPLRTADRNHFESVPLRYRLPLSAYVNTPLSVLTHLTSRNILSS